MNHAMATRNHPAYWAFLVHRISGLGLAIFLPLHLYVLSLALDAARLDGFLRWTEMPLLKAAETVLVICSPPIWRAGCACSRSSSCPGGTGRRR